MARQTITAQPALGAYTDTGVNLVWTVADPVNFEQVVLTGSEVLIAWNFTGIGPVNVTISSTDDPYGRADDLVESVDVDEYHFFGPIELEGWKQADGKLYFKSASADIKWAIINRLKRV